MKLLIRIKKLYLDFLLKNITAQTYDSVHDAILNSLNVNSLEHSNVIVTSEWEFDCILPNIRSYNEALTRIVANLQYNQMISSDWCRYEYMKVPYNKFFSEKTFYVDKVKELTEFIRLVKLLKDLYSVIREAPIGVEGHNARQVNKLIIHINDLIVQITRLSHEISLSKSSRL